MEKNLKNKSLCAPLYFLLKESASVSEHGRDRTAPCSALSSSYLSSIQFTGDFDLFFMHDVSAIVILHFAMLSAFVKYNMLLVCYLLCRAGDIAYLLCRLVSLIYNCPSSHEYRKICLKSFSLLKEFNFGTQKGGAY